MSIPELVAVDSSNVRAIGHDARLQLLFVEFNNGSLYEYTSVSKDLYVAFLTAPSKGQFVSTRLRDRYSYRRLR